MNEEKTAAEAALEERLDRDMNGEQAEKILAKFDEIIASQRSEKRMKNLEDANAKLSEDHAYLSLAHTALTIDDARFKSEAMRREQGLRDRGAALQANLEKTVGEKNTLAEKARALGAELTEVLAENRRWITLTGTLATKLVPVVGTFAQTRDGLMHFLDALPADMLRMSEKLTGHSRTIHDHETTIAALRAELSAKLDMVVEFESQLEATKHLYAAAQEDLKYLKPLLDNRAVLAQLIAHVEFHGVVDRTRAGFGVIRDFLKATEVRA